MLLDIVQCTGKPPTVKCPKRSSGDTEKPCSNNMLLIDHCKMLTTGHVQDQGQIQSKGLGVKRADIKMWVVKI